MRAQPLSRVQLVVTPWIVAHQAPLSMGFPRQEHWSGLPFPPPGDLPEPGIEPRSPALAGGIFITEYMESRNKKYKVFIIFDMTPKRYLLKRRTKCRSSLRGGLHFPRLTMYHDWNVIFMKLPGPAYEKINQEQFSLERFSSSGRKISKAKKWKLT